MSLVYKYDGAALAYGIAPAEIDIPQHANQGETVFGGIPIEDPDGTLTLVGHRPFTVEESECSQPRLFTGWTTERVVSRSTDNGLITADARLHDTTIVDVNALFNFRLITTSTGNRPAETWLQRRDWIVGSAFLSGLIEDTGYIGAPTYPLNMDPRDYRDGFAADVFSDLMQRSGDRLNYFAFWDPVAAAVGLFIGALPANTGESDLSISNDLADIGGDVYAPSMDATLTVAPDEVYSEVTVNWANGRVWRRRPSTATKYIRRGTVIDRPHAWTKTKGQEQAEAFLDRHDTEVDLIAVTIRVPASKAGLAMAGQAINVKFTHLPGYEDWMLMRISQSSPKPVDDLAALYDVALELEMPRAGSAPPETGCSYGGDPTAGTTSDMFGASVTGMIFNPGAAHAVTVDASNCVPYGSANGGDFWGVPPGPYTDVTLSADWTWDLSDLGSPAICTVLLTWDAEG